MIETSSQNILGLNQQTYLRLKLALSLSLRRQIFIAVCDDLPLRDRLASRLQQDLIQTASLQADRITDLEDTPEYPRLVTLKLDLQSPNPVVQIAQWLSFNPPPRSGKRRFSVPAFQFLGIEQLTRQPATVQRQFLTHLQGIERSLPVLDTSLLFWMPRPWFRTLPQSAQEFWRCRTAIFEFMGEPRPLSPDDEIMPHQAEPLPTLDPAPAEESTAVPANEATSPDSRPSANLWTILRQDLAQLDEGKLPTTEPLPLEECIANPPTGLTTPRQPQKTEGSPRKVTPLHLVSLTPPATPQPSPAPSASPVLHPPQHPPAQHAREADPLEVPNPTFPSTSQEEGELDRSAPVALKEKPELEEKGDRPFSPDHLPATTPTPKPQHQRNGHHPAPPHSGEPVALTEKTEQNGNGHHPPPTRPDHATPKNKPEENGHGDRAVIVAPPPQETTEPKPAPTEPNPFEEETLSALDVHTPTLTDTPSDSNAARPTLPLVEETNGHHGATDLETNLGEDVWPATLGDLDATTEVDRQISLFRDYIEQLHRQNASPSLLADTYRTLGDIYRDRIEQGESSPANLRGGIQAYEQVLVWLSETSPLWPDVLNDLGNLHWMLSRQVGEAETAEAHLQQAIQHYELGLARLDAESLPQNIAMIQNNLGAAHTDLARYRDAGPNLQRSVECYQQVLQYRTPQRDPARYASTQNNLGTAYWNLAQQERPRHYLKEAIAAYGEALEYCTSEDDPISFGMIHNNLGTAYWNLAQFERPQHWLQRAIESYQLALKYRTPQTSLTAYASTQNNLGTAYWHQASQLEEAPQRLDSWQKAIQAYDMALHAVAQLPPQTNFSFDLYASHANLGLAHYQMATDSQLKVPPEACGRHLELALEHHVSALKGWQAKPQLRQTALGHIIKTMRALYRHSGLSGQNLALSMVPADLLPEILPRL